MDADALPEVGSIWSGCGWTVRVRRVLLDTTPDVSVESLVTAGRVLKRPGIKGVLPLNVFQDGQMKQQDGTATDPWSQAVWERYGKPLVGAA